MPNSSAPEPMGARRLSDGERRALRDACDGLDPDQITLRRESGDTWRDLVLFVSGGRAVTLGHSIFLPDDRTQDLALIAHELTHCRQYQDWGAVRYYARGALEQVRSVLSRMGVVRDPYDWRSVPPMAFSEYTMEQQGQLVEDAYRGDPSALAIVAAKASTSSSVVSHDAIQRTSDRGSLHT